MKTLHLEIDRVIVEGLPETAQRRFADALKARLGEWARNEAARQLSGRFRSKVNVLHGGPLRPGATAAQAAKQVVDSIQQRVGTGEPKNSHSSQMNSGREARGHV